jgi:vacuolar-type H+-ATPase subunit I/STV1
MNEILGAGNTLIDYALVLLVYGLMFLFIRYPKPTLELNYRSNFLFLSLFWGGLMFIGNYLGYRLGVMAFLPWLDNFIHSFVWVGMCLTWLYYCTHERPMWEQIIFFVFASFIIKVAEKLLIGTWSMESYLGIKHPYAYIIAMSLVDGFYPVLSNWIIKALGKKSTFGIYTPQVV